MLSGEPCDLDSFLPISRIRCLDVRMAGSLSAIAAVGVESIEWPERSLLQPVL